jgi:hypothetical protein
MADGDPIIIGQANTASNPGNERALAATRSTPPPCSSPEI